MSDFKNQKWWPNNFHCFGDAFPIFWKEYLHSGEKRLLYIISKGFDSRMNAAISSIYKMKNNSEIDCCVLEFDDAVTSPSMKHIEAAERNMDELCSILEKKSIEELSLKRIFGKQVLQGRRAAELFSNEKSLRDYTDIVVDISAMPRSTYFPLVNQLINLCQMKNLHIVVAENFNLDARIMGEGIDENADYMFSFAGDMELVVSRYLPVIWFPVFGEGKEQQLRTIFRTIQNSLSDREVEICPILPFPAKNPRRVDNIISEYHRLLIDFEIEPRNIIYADEQNPFDVYRQIIVAGILYDDAFRPLGGCKKVVSALSSKLLSLGALIAAHEGKMAVAYVGAQGYIISDKNIHDDVDTELHEIWLIGEPYK